MNYKLLWQLEREENLKLRIENRRLKQRESIELFISKSMADLQLQLNDFMSKHTVVQIQYTPTPESYEAAIIYKV